MRIELSKGVFSVMISA